jgi:uncharacterized membrane protein YecN with MAPEG domain
MGEEMLQLDRTGGIPRFGSTKLVRAAAIALGMITLLATLMSPSPLVVLASGLVAIWMLVSLWKPNQLPVLLLPAFVQFSQVAFKPLTTSFNGASLQDLADYQAMLEPAVLFGLAGLSALVFGIRIGSGNQRSMDKRDDNWPFRSIVGLALSAIVLGHLLELVAEISGGAREIVLSLVRVKWAGLFAFTYTTLHLRRGLPWLIILVGIEIVLGLIGFFADFKVVLFVVGAAALTARGGTLRGGTVVALLFLTALTLGLMVFWSSIKNDYRTLLNRGTGEQAVLVPLNERLAFLSNRASDFDDQQFGKGWQTLVDRVSYIDLLAVTMERVPQILPHEDGALLGAAILHVMTPRILFPDKPSLPSDTEVTAYYTDLTDAVFADQNTSISIGYLAELYIDFGVFGALLAVFLMGLAYGRCYRAIRDYSCTPIFVNYALCMMLALTLMSFETALVKLVGSVATAVAAALLLQRFVWPALISEKQRVSNSGRLSRGTEP